MLTKTKLVAALVLGLLCTATGCPSNSKAPPPGDVSPDGAYFCCDAAGNCVLSPNGDCTDKIQWCVKTVKESDGTVVCDEWG